MSTSSIQEQVNEARASGTALRIAGRSHWMDAGRPVAARRVLKTDSLSGIVDYVPGDLTITVRSGTTLREISDVTAREGQWFPLDPFGDEGGGIGATIATGSFGPRAQRFGGIRDLVLGVEFVAGDGKIVRGGGRVVKNVAGFDLTRLLTGSWGTLGVITEATLRLYSRESQPVTLVLALPDKPAQLAEQLRALRSAPVTPYATELIGPNVASRLDLPARTSLLIEVGGNDAAVASQTRALQALGAEHVHTKPWDKLRLVDGEGASVVRVSAVASKIAEIWQTVLRALEPSEGVLMHASLGLGIVRCVVPAGGDAGAIARIAAACPDCSVIFERMPPHMWSALSPGVVGDRLSRGIRMAFDPANILNPGILGD